MNKLHDSYILKNSLSEIQINEYIILFPPYIQGFK